MKLFAIFFVIQVLLLFCFVFSATVSALESKCPYRTGSVYIIYPNQPTMSENNPINFDIVFESSPSAIVISPRSIQLSVKNQNFVDYNFSASSISSTGFNLIIKLNKNYNLVYSRVIINYWTNIGNGKLSCYHRLPNNALSIKTNTNSYLYEWKMNLDDNDKDWSALFFIPEFISQFPNKNMTAKMRSFQSTDDDMEVQYEINKNSNIDSFKLSAILYRKGDNYPNNYSYTIYNFSMSTQYDTQTFQEQHYQTTMFIGLRSIQGFVSNFGYYIGYQSQHINNNTLQYRQQHPYSHLIKKQNSSSIDYYQSCLISFTRTSCPTNTIYLYLETSTQLCHDKCPLGKFSSSQKICLSCNNYANIASYPQCYSNACEEGFYIQPTLQGSAPYQKCSLCSSKIVGCNKCFTNSTGNVYCQQCDNYYHFGSNTCTICSVVFSNCSTCSPTNCLTCLLSSQTQFVNGVCITCNSSSYFNFTDRVCYSCNSKIPNCQSCTSDTVCTSCFISSKTQLINPTLCQPCNSTSYYDQTTMTCQICSNLVPNCSSCELFPTYFQCKSCIIGSNRYLFNNQCIPCNINQYFSHIDSTCKLCSLTTPNCQQCNFPSPHNCSKCQIMYEVINGMCHSCNSSSYYNPTTFKCHLCSNQISDCIQCNYEITNNSVVCTLCNQELINGQCKNCLQYEFFNTTNRICIECMSLIPNCIECEIVLNDNLQCSKCNSSYLNPLYLSQLTYTCEPCSQYCRACTSQTVCTICTFDGSITTMLKNGICIRCNPDQSDIQSIYPFCEDQQRCPFSNYNYQLGVCEAQQLIEKIMFGLNVIISIPTLNYISTSVASIISFFDDFSYYPYHKRNYSEGVSLFFEITENFTLSRFIPLNIKKLAHNYLSFGQNILQQDFNRTPQEFYENDQSIYFMVTTENYWTKHILATIAVFFLLMFINWVSNKIYPNKFFKVFSYPGVIMITILNSNIQYLSFHCFSQIFQPIPPSKQYYFNLIFCYFTLMILIMYSCSAISIFKTFHTYLNQQYVLLDVFQNPWAPWFLFNNIYKIISAFVHSYFYYNTFLQHLLLTFVLCSKAVVFCFIVKRVNEKIQFAFEFVSNWVFCMLQCLFLIQIYLIQFQGYQQQSFRSFDIIECFLILLMGFCEIIKLVTLTSKHTILIILSKLSICNKSKRITKSQTYKNHKTRGRAKYNIQFKKQQKSNNKVFQIILSSSHTPLPSKKQSYKKNSILIHKSKQRQCKQSSISKNKH